MTHAKRAFRSWLPILLPLLICTSGCDFLGSDGGSTTRVDLGSSSASAIDISGGAGTVGAGGDGDQEECGIWLDNYGPAGLRIYRAGAADASFTLDLPAATPEFGAEPLIVTTDMTVPVYETDPADNNVYYFLGNDPTLWHKTGDAAPPDPVTGIQVRAGATLTLGINADRNYSGARETAFLSLENDLEVLGTLRAASFDDPSTQESDNPRDRAGLVIATSGGVFVRPTGVVSTAGDDATSGRGGHGGSIELSASRSEAPNGGIIVSQGLIDASGGDTDDADAEGGNSALFGASGNCVNLYAESRFVSTGAIRADGGSGRSGGHFGGWDGNSAYVGGSGTVQNTGIISLTGGTGSNGDGGNGGSLDLAAGEVSLHNSGAVATRGGDGSQYGGSGGNVNMYVSSVGDLLNSGAIDAAGGDSTGTDDSVAGYGGQGGQVYIYTFGGRLASSAQIAADGGDVANLNRDSYGGQGGYVDIESLPDYWSWTSPADAMEISGNIFARGGAGPNGGYGGMVYARYDDPNGTGGIVLRGYSRLVNDGGAGVANGGGGGGVYLYDGYSAEEGAPEPAGLLTEADVSANGGAATDSGGYGGYVDLWSSAPPSQYRGITVDGGAGATPGDPGSIYIDGGGGPV